MRLLGDFSLSMVTTIGFDVWFVFSFAYAFPLLAFVYLSGC